MTPDQWQKVSRALTEALNLGPESRADFLAKLRAGEPSVCAEVESLLQQDDTDEESSLESVPSHLWNLLADADKDDTLTETIASELPQRIGPYEIEELLGRGGMGVVYKARQTDLNRTVALKMILVAGHAGEQETQRFLTEAEAVARLQHVNIVQLYEFGRHDGLPYFTLEYVPGGSLAAKLTEGPLPPKPAAGLIEQVARGIQHAHENGIVHRDLKPANILIADRGSGIGDREKNHDESARFPIPDSRFPVRVPKLTDFGLAKRVEAGTAMTATGAVMGTPSYMAPEQAHGDARRVGPAADVYALGAVLYECVTGRPPFQADNMLETLKQVVDREPAPPSVLNAAVDRDLETICLKCLQKAPSRRYESAAAVADDLNRFLAGQPIVARPVTYPERLWRWAKRKPAVAGLAAAILLLLIVATTVSTVAAITINAARVAERQQRRRAEKAEGEALAEAERAKTEAAAAEQVAMLLKDLVHATDPFGFQGLGFRLQETSNAIPTELLDDTEKRIESAFRDRPLIRARLLDTLGTVEFSLGLESKGEKLVRRALALRKKSLPADDPSIAMNLFHLGWFRHAQKGYAQAVQHYQQAIDTLEAAGANELQIARIQFAIAWALCEQRRYEEAEELFRQVVAVRTKELPAGHRDLMYAQYGLVNSLLEQKKFLALLPEIRRFLITKDEKEGLAAYVSARIYRSAKNYKKAAAEYRRAVKLAQKAFGEHPYTALLLGDFAKMMLQAEDYDEAEKLIEESTRIGKKVLPTHPKLITAIHEWADVVHQRGELDKAERLYRDAFKRAEIRYSAGHPISQSILSRLNEVLEKKKISQLGG